MKRLLVMAVLVGLACVRPADCQSRFAVGVRGGVLNDYDNPEFQVPHKFDLNELTMFGGHIQLRNFTVFTLEIAVESNRRSDELSVLGETVSAEVKDLTIAANLKYIFRIPMLTPYIGGGIASHMMNYEFNSALDYVAIDEIIKIPEDGSRFGIHGIAGVAFGFATSPIEVFVEGRVGRIEGEEESARYKAIYGGITLKLL